jgi:prepilin-type N-terminal cleavage/methylation domain-containing protein
MLKNNNKAFTRSEKLMDNILIVKVGRIIKKLFSLKQKNSGVFLTGFTLIEALVVIAIIATLSVFYVINLRPNTAELLKMDTTRLAADIRYVRSMAASRAIYNNGTFPTGGYGIFFKNGNGTTAKSYYTLFAGNPNNEIKKVYLSNVAFRLVDPNSTLSRDLAIKDEVPKSFIFASENIVTSDLKASEDGDYQIEIYHNTSRGVDLEYSKSQINIGRKTADSFVWSNLSITYDARGIVCGNGIVETGESCERCVNTGCTLDPNSVVDANCFPAGFTINSVAMGCKYNSCGDGVIAGTEQCEKIDDPRYYANRCANVPHYGWCYDCVDSTAVCSTVGISGVNCCQANLTGTCTDCQWSSSSCLPDIKICPIDSGI